ncbi:hypothetical protein PR048_023656 [Dryococelus australis]|uniref:DUF4371 domain-containing protein n=1 Tax=Dryococelus australis TaxID=614101 RepID=A0ABQ9GUR1_9NEOP|nr:hypothetical protein PR048_023656 [Dryococelus australis]
MADETTDTSIKEHLASCIRYFDTTSYEIQEKFFKFFDVVDVSGENIARAILQELDRLYLDISYCCGQAYNVGSNMSGKFKGVQARIAKVQPLAIYSHCANYRLNLTISKACSMASIRNAIGVLSSVSNLFRESAWRIHKLETEVQDKLPHLKKGKYALNMCETRWIEKHDAVLTFLDTLPCLPFVLETISESSESTGCNAFSFLHAIQSSEFLVSVVVLAEVFGLTLPLARNSWKQHYKSTDTFKKIFKEFEKLVMEMDTKQPTCRKTDQTYICKQLKNTIAL